MWCQIGKRSLKVWISQTYKWLGPSRSRSAGSPGLPASRWQWQSRASGTSESEGGNWNNQQMHKNQSSGHSTPLGTDAAVGTSSSFYLRDASSEPVLMTCCLLLWPAPSCTPVYMCPPTHTHLTTCWVAKRLLKKTFCIYVICYGAWPEWQVDGNMSGSCC